MIFVKNYFFCREYKRLSLEFVLGSFIMYFDLEHFCKFLLYGDSNKNIFLIFS